MTREMRAWYLCVTEKRTEILLFHENSIGNPEGLNFLNELRIRLCSEGAMPMRHPPIMKTPFTYVDYTGRVILTITDPETIAKITAAILCQTK